MSLVHGQSYCNLAKIVLVRKPYLATECTRSCAIRLNYQSLFGSRRLYVHESQVGWLILLFAAVWYSIQVFVYQDTAYLILGCSTSSTLSIHYNLRCIGSLKQSTLFSFEQMKRFVTALRAAIELHFA
jgi:hypothetical protein